MHILQSLSHPTHTHYFNISHFNKCGKASPVSLYSESCSFVKHTRKDLSFLRRQHTSFSVTNLRSSSSEMTNSIVERFKSDSKLDEFVEVGNKVADAAGQLISKYFRKPFDILDKEDLSPVTIADRAAEEAMRTVISEHFPTHAIFGEENGWTCKEESAEYVWVLDPIDGTKSFITGGVPVLLSRNMMNTIKTARKPLFGTLIALVHKGIPIVGIIDQPILHERWIGKIGEKTTFNGLQVSTRPCNSLAKAYMYTTSPHLFSGEAEEAFGRVRNKVKVPLYGCDCYAYALLASGHVDLVIESGLKLYDFMALVPVIEAAGGIITDWKGQKLTWKPSSDGKLSDFNVIAAGDATVHQEALSLLQWN